ncbi:MAG: hypothetical protein NUW01_13525 [Gemmatimonadaceae bacterium]|nr:hypothetical protein [Gemmatimonadaceae bacterium]
MTLTNAQVALLAAAITTKGDYSRVTKEWAGEFLEFLNNVKKETTAMEQSMTARPEVEGPGLAEINDMDDFAGRVFGTCAPADYDHTQTLCLHVQRLAAALRSLSVPSEVEAALMKALRNLTDETITYLTDQKNALKVAWEQSCSALDAQNGRPRGRPL